MYAIPLLGKKKVFRQSFVQEVKSMVAKTILVQSCNMKGKMKWGATGNTVVKPSSHQAVTNLIKRFEIHLLLYLP